MARAKNVLFSGTVENMDAATSVLQHAGDMVLIHRGRPRMIVMRCPCGCGDNLIINLDKRTGYAWRLYMDSGGITLYPSYWREDGCRSHFIVWNSRIFWCLDWQSDEGDACTVSQSLEDSVLDLLHYERFVNYQEIAERLNIIPWEALQACRQLVDRGAAIQDTQ